MPIDPNTETRLQQLHEAVASLPEQSPYADILTIVRRPGWTTPAEAMLFETITRSLVVHVEAVRQLHFRLLEAAKHVGVAQPLDVDGRNKPHPPTQPRLEHAWQ